MALVYNNVEIPNGADITYNEVHLDEIIYDETAVWKKQSIITPDTNPDLWKISQNNLYLINETKYGIQGHTNKSLGGSGYARVIVTPIVTSGASKINIRWGGVCWGENYTYPTILKVFSGSKVAGNPLYKEEQKAGQYTSYHSDNIDIAGYNEICIEVITEGGAGQNTGYYFGSYIYEITLL